MRHLKLGHWRTTYFEVIEEFQRRRASHLESILFLLVHLPTVHAATRL